MLGDNMTNALLGGQTYGQNVINYNLLNDAHAAQVAQYGPGAGDPAAMASLQNTNYLGKLDPLLVNQQQSQNAITGVQANIAQATQGSTAAKDNALNVGAVQQVPAQVANTAATAANNTAVARQTTQAADAGQALQDSTAASAMANGMESHLQSNPGDTEGAYKAGLTAADAVGHGEAKNYAIGTPNGDAFHAQFAADPQGTINGVRQMTDAHLRGAMQNLTPAQQIQFQKNNADYQNTTSDIIAKKQQLFTAAQGEVKSILGAQGPVGVGLVQADAALANIDKMRGLVKGLSDTTAWNDTVGKNMPGSAMQQIEALAHATSSALSVDMMAGIKQANASGSGLGIRSNTEFKAVGDALMQIDPAMTKGQLKAQLDQAEAGVRQYKLGAENMLGGPNGPAEYKNAKARANQAEADYNQALGVYRTPGGAPASPSASPAAPASPSGAAVVAPAGAAAAPYNADFFSRVANSPSLDVSHFTAPFGGALQATLQDAEKEGLHVKILSGSRSMDTQNELYQNMNAKRAGKPLPFPNQDAPSVAAAPGHSYHEFGNAADVGVFAADGKRDSKGQNRLDAIAKSHGLVPGTTFGDQGHFQIAGPPDTGTPPASAASASAAPAAPGMMPTPAPLATVTPTPQATPQDASRGQSQPTSQRVAPTAAAAPPQAAPQGALARAGSPADDPIMGVAARAFQGTRSQVMDGRALLAKYLGSVA